MHVGWLKQSQMLFTVRQTPSCPLTDRINTSQNVQLPYSWLQVKFRPLTAKMVGDKKNPLGLKFGALISVQVTVLPHRWAELSILSPNEPLPMFVAGIRRKWPVIGSRTNWYPTGGRGRCSDGPNWTGTWAKNTKIKMFQRKGAKSGVPQYLYGSLPKEEEECRHWRCNTSTYSPINTVCVCTTLVVTCPIKLPVVL
jgi:hypothetical protein